MQTLDFAASPTASSTSRCVFNTKTVYFQDREQARKNQPKLSIHRARIVRSLEDSMHRRQFMFGSVGMAAVLWANRSAAEIACSPYFPNGVQRCQSGIDSSLAHISAQANSQWCWAASIAMIFNYYGHPVSQFDIVNSTWGGIVNMPAQAGQILANLNRNWTDDSGGAFSVMGDVYSANHLTAAQDLAQDMPLIIGTMGHAMVLTSLVYDRDMAGNGIVNAAVVRDPWPGRGRRVLSAEEWYRTNFLARIRVA